MPNELAGNLKAKFLLPPKLNKRGYVNSLRAITILSDVNVVISSNEIAAELVLITEMGTGKLALV